jgi:hypothetical protein
VPGVSIVSSSSSSLPPYLRIVFFVVIFVALLASQFSSTLVSSLVRPARLHTKREQEPARVSASAQPGPCNPTGHTGRKLGCESNLAVCGTRPGMGEQGMQRGQRGTFCVSLRLVLAFAPPPPVLAGGWSSSSTYRAQQLSGLTLMRQNATAHAAAQPETFRGAVADELEKMRSEFLTFTTRGPPRCCGPLWK